MTKRITIVLDDDLNKKLLLVQSKLIAKAAKVKTIPPSNTRAKNISFSYVINLTLRKELN